MTAPMMTLQNGSAIPQVGLGVFAIADDEARDVVQKALQIGYRHIDTAAQYGNERGVGRGIAESGVRREDIFVTTKLWVDDFDDVAGGFQRSLDALGTGYIDLFLMHWPVPKLGKYVDVWKEMIEIQATGKTRAIGVSNFEPDHLREIVEATGTAPAINQVELHPYFQQSGLKRANAELGVVTQAWSPLAQGVDLLGHPELARIAARHGKTTAQVVLRWHVQLGHVVIPKSSSAKRLAQNIEFFDFELSGEDLAAIASLEDPEGGRLGHHPNDRHSAHVSLKSRQRMAELAQRGRLTGLARGFVVPAS